LQGFIFSEKIDKKKLFKIACKNALSLPQKVVLPVDSVKKENVANVPSKTVDELIGNALSKYFPFHEYILFFNFIYSISKTLLTIKICTILT